MEYVDLATFTFATWQIRSCWLCKFISPGACPFTFPSIFRSFRQENRIVELFYWSKLRDRKENEIFASQAKNAMKHARITSLAGKYPPQISVPDKNVAALTFSAWKKKIVFSAPKASGFSLCAILRGFLTDLWDWCEFFGCLIEAS